jgi:hypothetical protein
MRAADSGVSVEVVRFGSISEIRRPFRPIEGIEVFLRLHSRGIAARANQSGPTRRHHP